jgi:protocatechuate 3,4-dioxygenase beta subunit
MADQHDHDDHKHGLQFDLEQLLQQRRGRRGVLALLGGGSVAAAMASYAPGVLAADAVCVVDATETAGPYPGDGSNAAQGSTSNILSESGVVRSDIRSSFGTSTNTAAGVPLTLTVTIADANNGCAALPGYVIYVWHCTQDGLYSLYTAPDENYLRGVQVADADGKVTFTTIFPGCYPGRWPHIHFEVYPNLVSATSHDNALLTSQFALPNDVCAAVYAGAAGYEQSAANLPQISIARDMVFADNSEAQMTMMTPAITGDPKSGYTATATVAIAV